MTWVEGLEWKPESKTLFKKCFQKGLLQLLGYENTYVDAHTLIKDLNFLHSVPIT